MAVPRAAQPTHHSSHIPPVLNRGGRGLGSNRNNLTFKHALIHDLINDLDQICREARDGMVHGIDTLANTVGNIRERARL
jgi:hypothetical protein